ncbi:zinc metalloprotease HtpX [Candidatus Uhrbacteria bacterium CG_4_9_14_3_um_filter_36_7]|uniref:Protease HtpX homolog n=1 Tax=Candidatus Uhrbacteria bacterium CG_4_9_14_3_um_filter_36_7 TaxID=1975033 RepID=A0A2M7XHX8_9BACT|nr:MAG: zinc metalloprotease HtpX [Candidatus Uhrbacteria bacterium CG_4_9_14_3_um_filter_36_7]
MYSQIESNKRKTVFLIFIFTLIILILGALLGYFYENIYGGVLVAIMISLFISFFGFFQADRVALASSGAKRIESKDHPELYRLVENLAISAGLPTPAIYIITDPSPNAFATGRDPNHASVAVTTGLLSIMEKIELEGVIAHELSHIKNYDIRVMTIIVVLFGLIVLLSDFLMRSFFFSRREGREGQATVILMIIGIILAILSPFIAEIIKLAISRNREYLADASGALMTRYPEGLARALEKIAAHDRPLKRANHATAHLFLANPFDPHVSKKFESWFSTHPPIEERIKKLRLMMS